MLKLILIVTLWNPLPALGSEPCMDANYSQLLKVERTKNKSSITIKIKTRRPEDIYVEEKPSKGFLILELHNSFIIQRKIVLGLYIKLKDMGGWTQLRVKGGKKLLSKKVKGSYLILVVSL
jgi:hypothetical protein